VSVTAIVLVRRLLMSPGSSAADEVLGHCETAAIHTALRLRNELGGTVVAVSVGPEKRDKPALERALALGCDRAIRISDQGLDELDSVGIATILAAACKSLSYKFVLCGDRSQDGAQGAVGPAVAAFLTAPHLSGVVSARVADERLLAKVRNQGKVIEFHCKSPAVLCVRSFAGEKSSAASSDRSVEELARDSLDLDLDALKKRRKLGGYTRPLRTGSNAVLVESGTDLYNRLREERLLG
jgi:electron transfer flavoprotein alpha/beta subunit